MVNHYKFIRVNDITKQNFVRRKDNLSKLFGRKIPMTKLLQFVSEQETIYPEDFAKKIMGKKRR